MKGDCFEDLVAWSHGVPVPEGFGFGGIQDHPRDVEGAVFGFGGDIVATEALVAPGGELTEGPCGLGSAGEIKDSLSGGELSLGEDLVEDQGGQIARVEAVADLVALTIEADVAQRSTAEVAVDPIGEDALVGSTELTGAGHDAATVDENLEAERLAVFQREHFAGEFC